MARPIFSPALACASDKISYREYVCDCESARGPIIGEVRAREKDRSKVWVNGWVRAGADEVCAARDFTAMFFWCFYGRR